MEMFFIIKDLIFVTLLLALSFFVLLGVSKTNSRTLKLFGYLIAILLWISVALAATTKIYVMSSSKCSVGSKMDYRMHKKNMMGKKGMHKGKMMYKEGMHKEK